MDELARELASLREDVVPAWSDARSDRLYAGVGQLRRRRRVQKAGAFALVTMIAGGALLARSTASTNTLSSGGDSRIAITDTRGLPSAALQPMSATHAVVASAPDSTLPATALQLRAHESTQLADGSRIGVTSAEGELAVERNEKEHIDVRLTAGVAHFDVVPNSTRHFVVAAGSVEVAVIGTVFDVERGLGRVRVAVSRGKVRVRSVNGVGLVQAGESSWFNEASDAHANQSANHETAGNEASEPTATTPVTNAVAPAKVRASRSKRGAARDDAPRASWRSLSQSGDYEGAYQLLAQGTAVDDDSEALMDAADASRLSGHPEASVTYLRKVLLRHRESPVAPLAAFTLGRVLLERLGQPTEAADAFALARSLAPQGSLAQDALAREVEAWSKAGHPHEAYERARLYVLSYPQGRRLHAVQLYGVL